MVSHSERELIAAAIRGDERAFGVFFDLHVEPVYVLALEELGSADDAQDVTQQVFAIAWSKLPKIRLVDGSALPWLLTTCRNLTSNRLRSVRRRPVTENFDDLSHTLAITDEFETVRSRDLIDRMEKEVAAMPELDQNVYRQILRDGRSYEAVAASLGVSVASVRKRLNRVRNRLRSKFGGEL
ncbi:sigma-70 family RNA polymerase sigma factor [Okibacterium endophyticum]